MANYKWGEGQEGGKWRSPAQPNWAQTSILPMLASALQKTQGDYEQKQKMALQQQQNEADQAKLMAYGAQQTASAEKIAEGNRLQEMWKQTYTDDATWASQWTDPKTGRIKPGAPKRPLLVFFDQVGPENIRNMGLEGVYQSLTHPPGAIASEAAQPKVIKALVPQPPMLAPKYTLPAMAGALGQTGQQVSPFVRGVGAGMFPVGIPPAQPGFEAGQEFFQNLPSMAENLKRWYEGQ